MNVIDFHPDDLLDREILGNLSPAESRRLRGHLRGCAQCRLERQLRTDFEEELGARDEPQAVQTFVRGALRAADARRGSTSPIWKRRLVFLLAAAIVFATGLAAADIEIAGRAWTATREKIAEVLGSRLPKLATTSQPPKVAPSAIGPGATEMAASPSMTFGETANSLEEVATAEAPEPAHPVSPEAAVRAIAVRHRPAVEVTRVAPKPVTEPSVAADETHIGTILGDSPSALLDRAGSARRRGNLLEAAALYHDLEARFPASPEARLSIAIVARMQLDLGETTSAVSGFDAYLDAGDRALREEAMAGRALALGRLGRSAEELEGWRTLLRAYPSSGYAQIARKRLGGDLP